MKKILYFLSATDATLVENCSPRARIQRKTIGAFVLFGMVVASVSGFMFGYSIKHVWWHGLIGGAITSVFIGLQDRSLFLSYGKFIVAARLVLLLGSSYILSLPLKVWFVQESIQSELDESYRQENLKRFAGVANEDANFAERRTKAEAEIERLQRERTNYLRMRDAENTGYSLAAGNSGVSGQGPRWRSYNDQANQLANEIQRRQDALTNVTAQHAKDRSLAENQFEMTKVEPEYSFTACLAGLDRLLKNSDEYKSGAAKKVNLILTILFILFEAAPALLKAFLPHTDYEIKDMKYSELSSNLHNSVSDHLNQQIADIGATEEDAEFEKMKKIRDSKTKAYDDIQVSVNHYFA